MLCLYQLRVEAQQVATLRIKATGQPPTLTLATDKQWHLFLSHNWANQDVVATIKRQLQLLLPGVRAFLDVDDLERIDDLERYIEASQAMLVLLGSPKYLQSANCAREAATAERLQLPLVRVHDADTRKNGATFGELRRAANEPRNRLSRQTTAWLLDSDDVIPWHRAADFQGLSLAKIAERLLLASPAHKGVEPPSLYVDGGLAWAQPSFARPVALHVSAANLDAADAVRVLTEEHADALQRVDSLDVGGWDAASARWLLFVSPTCFAGEMGARLAAEVAAALSAGVEPVVLWSPETCGDFGDVIECTPRSLVEAGLYGHLAIEWWQGMHRAVSVRLVAKALGARMGGRADGGCARVCCAALRPMGVSTGGADQQVSDGQSYTSRSGLVIIRCTSLPSARAEEGTQGGQHDRARMMSAGQMASDDLVQSGLAVHEHL